MTSLQVASVRRVLGSSSGSISFPDLFTKLAGCTLGRIIGCGPEETETNLAEETTESELLNMGKPKMAQLEMPLEPNALQWRQVLVGRGKDPIQKQSKWA